MSLKFNNIKEKEERGSWHILLKYAVRMTSKKNGIDNLDF